MNIAHRIHACRGATYLRTLVYILGVEALLLGLFTYLKHVAVEYNEEIRSQLTPPEITSIPTPIAAEVTADWNWVFARSSNPPAIFIYHLTNVTVTSYREIETDGSRRDGALKYWAVIANWRLANGSIITKEIKLRTPSTGNPVFVGVGQPALGRMLYKIRGVQVAKDTP